MSIIRSLAFLMGRRSVVALMVLFAIVFAASLGVLLLWGAPSPDPMKIVKPTPTPTPEWAPTLTPTRNISVVINETEEEWSICDDRHNASHLYAMGCYGSSGGSSGGSSSPTLPPPPIPELRAFSMLLIGLVSIWLIAVRQKGRAG